LLPPLPITQIAVLTSAAADHLSPSKVDSLQFGQRTSDYTSILYLKHNSESAASLSVYFSIQNEWTRFWIIFVWGESTVFGPNLYWTLSAQCNPRLTWILDLSNVVHHRAKRKEILRSI